MSKPTPDLSIQVKHSLPRREPPQEREYVVYHWGRIVGALIAMFVMVGVMIWGGLWLFESSAVDEESVPAEQPLRPAPSTPKSETPPEPEPMVQGAKDEASGEVESSRIPLQSQPLPAKASEPGTDTEALSQEVTKPIEPEEEHTSFAGHSVGVDNTEAENAEVESTGTESAGIERTEPESTEAKSVDTDTVPGSMRILSEHLTRAQLTSGLADKEPVDELPRILTMTPEGLLRVYLFTETHNLKDAPHFHDWYHEGERVARVRILPYTDQMRASSSKYVDRHMLGQWRVEVVTANGKVLAWGEFTVHP